VRYRLLTPNANVGKVMDNCLCRVWFCWTANSTGAYFYKNTYGRADTYRPSVIRLLAVTKAVPISLHFNTTKTKLSLGETVDLEAKPVDARWCLSSSIFRNRNSSWLQKDGRNRLQTWKPSLTGPQPKASTICTATASTPSASESTSKPFEAFPSRRNLLQLDVRAQIQLQLSYSLTLDLPSVNDQPTTYNVQASFQGDNPSNATAYGYTPNGTVYAVCTTVQYGYKPSCNCTCLTVEPQATQILTAAKTPEQTQWLNIYSEWSWWYPWFRLHFSLKYNGQLMLDVGVAVLPGADTANFPDTTFKGKINEWLGKIALNVITSVVVTEFALWAASNLGPIYFGLVLLSYIAYKAVNLFVLGWNSVESLYVSLVSTLVSTAISAWTGLCSFLPANLRTLAASAESIKNLVFAFLCKIIMIPINIWLLMEMWGRIVALGGA
jgi:hypothetical protein